MPENNLLKLIFRGESIQRKHDRVYENDKNTSNLTDEDASLIAASKAHDSMPKSRMYYRIEASRNIGGGKKVDPKSNMTDKLKVRN